MRLLSIISDHELRQQITAICSRDSEIELFEPHAEARFATAGESEFADVVLLSISVARGKLSFGPSRRTARLRCVLFRAVANPSGALAGSVQSGLDGYLLRKIEPESLIQAVKLIHRGRSILDPELTRKALRALPKSIQTYGNTAPQLSKRELEVIALMAGGMSNLEIAKNLYISVRTVKSHTTHIMTKLGTKNRVGSVMAALRHGLLGGDS